MVLKKEITLQIKNLLKENPQGLRITDIVKKVDINRNTAGRYLENLLVSGQVEMRRFGMAKIYSLSQRVPLSALLSISSELVIQLDSSLRIIFANEPFILLVGTDSKSLVGKNIEYTPVALVFEDFFPEFIEHLREGVSGNEWVGEISVRPKDIILFCRIAPTVFDDGRKGVSVILEDITLRKKAEVSLQESEERYRTLVEISPDGVLIHQLGKIVFINLAALSILGASQSDEIIGKNILDFIHPDFRDTIMKNIEKDLIGVVSPTTELHMLRIDGTSIIVEGRGVKTNIDGKPAIQVAIRDITQRKRVEAILQKNEKQYRSLVETTGTGYVILDKEGRVITANQEYVRLTGRSTLAEIEKRSVTDWTASYDIERNVRKIDDCLRRGGVRDFEVDYQKPDGTIQPIEVNASVIQSDSEQIILTLCRDITERKRAEEALRESEGKLNAILKSIPDPMSMMDKDLTIVWANEPAKRYFGNDIIGKKCYEVYHLRQDPCDPYPCLTLKAFFDGKTHQHETTVIDNQEKERFFDCTATVALWDNSGKPVAVLETSRDITEKKKALNILRESEERYRTLAEASNDLIFLIGKDDRVEYVNSYASGMVNKPVNQIIGHPRSSLFSPDVARNQKKGLDVVFETGNPVRNEGILEFNGQKYWFDHLLTPLKDTDFHIQSVLGISRDITQQKMAEDSLRDSEEKYRTLVERANDVICIVQDGIIKMCNSRLPEFWGGSIEEIIGKPISEFIHPDAQTVVIDRYNQRMRGESPPSIYETILMRKDGSKSYVELNAGIVTYEGKNADLVIVRDINERKNATQAIRESEGRLRHLLDSTEDLIFLQDPEGRYLYFNAAPMYGLPVEKVLGSMPYDLLDRESAERIVKRLKKVVKTGQSIIEETMFVWKGQTLWFSDNLSPIRDANGTITAVVTVSHNITDRKNSEKALRESEEKYRSLVTTTGDIIWETDDQAHFVFVSPQVESIIGFKPDELIGHTPFEFLKPDAIGPNQKMFRMAVENKEKSIVYISHWIHKNGHSVYLESHAVPIYRHDGSFSGFIGIDRKKTV